MNRSVVSLVPSVTETLLAWGVTPQACTRFCEQPDLPHVGGTKDPDIEAIVAMRPGMVVMCDEENRREDAEALAAAGVRVQLCSPRSVNEVEPALAGLAAAVEVDLPHPTAPLVLPPLGLRVFVPIWRRPWMSIAGDTYGASLLASVGVIVAAPEGGGRYPEVTLEWAAAQHPDLVLAPSEPYSFRERHLSELAEVAPVVAVDGQDLFWWGVRTPVAQRRLHRVLGQAAQP